MMKKIKDDWVNNIPKEILTEKHKPCNFGKLIQPALHFDVKAFREKRKNKGKK